MVGRTYCSTVLAGLQDLVPGLKEPWSLAHSHTSPYKRVGKADGITGRDGAFCIRDGGETVWDVAAGLDAGKVTNDTPA